jgi:hypothetical protein
VVGVLTHENLPFTITAGAGPADGGFGGAVVEEGGAGGGAERSEDTVSPIIITPRLGERRESALI